MKSIKFLFFLILTLSLSAITIYSPIALCDYNIGDNQCENTNSVAINCSCSNNINSNEEDHIEVFKENNTMLYLTNEDIYLMSQVVYAESKGEPFEGKVAVASVILNRAVDCSFPNTIKEVIFQPYAFSCIVDGKLSVEPSQECFDAVYEALAGNDPTDNALFFYNPQIATCNWMKGVEKINSKSIGQHLFFRI